MSLHLSIQAEKTCRSELHLTQSSQSYWVRCLDREAGRKMHLHLFIISLSLYCHNGRRGKIACFRNGSKWLTDQTNVNNVHRAKQGSLSTWCRRLASAPSSRRLEVRNIVQSDGSWQKTTPRGHSFSPTEERECHTAHLLPHVIALNLITSFSIFLFFTNELTL